MSVMHAPPLQPPRARGNRSTAAALYQKQTRRAEQASASHVKTSCWDVVPWPRGAATDMKTQTLQNTSESEGGWDGDEDSTHKDFKMTSDTRITISTTAIAATKALRHLGQRRTIWLLLRQRGNSQPWLRYGTGIPRLSLA